MWVPCRWAKPVSKFNDLEIRPDLVALAHGESVAGLLGSLQLGVVMCPFFEGMHASPWKFVGLGDVCGSQCVLGHREWG